jgi:hypothetical protein
MLPGVEPHWRRHLGRDDAHDDADHAALLEDVHAVAHAVGRAVREVDLEVVLEVRALPFAHHGGGERGDGLAGERRDVADRA